MKNQKHAFAVVRVENDMPENSAPENRITVKEIVPTQEIAEAEVKRLNQLNKDKGCMYFWQVTRIVGAGTKQKQKKN